MVTITNEHFSLSQICQSGQCFRMNQTEHKNYKIIAGQRYLEACEEEGSISLFCSKEEFHEFWEDYFDLKRDYQQNHLQINPNDSYLLSAASFGWGIRILKQDLWETIVSFLISQQNNIVRIRRCIEQLCKVYGKEMVSVNGEAYYSFPTPEALSGLEENQLMACNLGYRSKYVVRAAKSVVSGDFDLNQLRSLPYKQAKEELMKLFGVGEKVADCVCLFGLHHLDAFPVDTHINQALQAHYKRGFPNKRYQGFKGVLQQYIFYYELYGRQNVSENKRI
ncbi:MAG: 8-oxoguanine DNA glycosylase [Lachnospiraceae bacterium]|jgi:N-glycosylase/DNA lyase|nr:8-oxoguanine DNA glycosylase [Lachnospiraceae bacterium]